uniref:Wsv137-like protein n=1 Tax=Hemigrapsus takanoi nimavirus TaxID=2133792 RepID=A0A401IP50_9VIRU|nr:MAG: wsv137-like protein [Hemigrapsus takanoi nimavirus]GBG35387.1 wsv137-like protein [Hemigrapsus takanoi nimavirus]
MAVNTIRISGIDVGEGVTAAADVMDVVSSALEQDVCEMFIDTLYGESNVFNYIIENEDVSDKVVLTLIADDNVSITVHVSQPSKSSNSFTSLSFSIFNATMRTCILPYASKQREPVYSFPDVDISSLEGVFECEEKKRVYPTRCDYNLKWFLSEALKNHIMDTGEINSGEKKQSSNIDEESLKINKDMASFTGETFKGMILNETDADIMKKLFQHGLRSGAVENKMMCCLNPDHNDTNPSMNVTVLPFSWQKSKKIVVDEETNEELMNLYYKDEGMGTKFTYISDNAVRDTRTDRIYILYTIRKKCYSCSFRC